jgi:hypothetical protein
MANLFPNSDRGGSRAVSLGGDALAAGGRRRRGGRRWRWRRRRSRGGGAVGSGSPCDGGCAG